MKSLYESILDSDEQVVDKTKNAILNPHFEELLNDGFNIKVEQIELYYNLQTPRKDKIFPHDSKIFDNAYKKLESKLPVSKQSIINRYFKKYVEFYSNFLRDPNFRDQVAFDIDREAEFGLMYIYYLLYKLEETKYWSLSQNTRKKKIWSEVVDKVNNEIGCNFLNDYSTNNPENYLHFTFDDKPLGFHIDRHKDAHTPPHWIAVDIIFR